LALFSLGDLSMTTKRYFMTIFLGLAAVILPTGIFGTEDIASLLETKGPAEKGIITEPSIVRVSKLPRLPIDQRQIEFLIDHPHVALALAHLYAPFLDNYRIGVRPDHTIHIDEPNTLAGDAELIDVRPGRRIYFIAGYYDVFNIRFKGNVVLVTMYSEQRESAPVFVDASTIAYFKITSGFAGVFARLADYMFPKKVDERIEHLIHAAENISIAVHNDPADTYRRLKASAEVSTEELESFCRTFLQGALGTASAGVPAC
jgi:hypothetical protein